MGKVSRAGIIRYTPAGTAVREVLVAVPQEGPEGTGIGYFPLLLFGTIAEESQLFCRVGKQIKVQGRLWMRFYRDRQGKRREEFKVVANALEDVN